MAYEYRKTTRKMAYGVSMLYHLHMPSYILRTFTEYPYLCTKGDQNLEMMCFTGGGAVQYA